MCRTAGELIDELNGVDGKASVTIIDKTTGDAYGADGFWTEGICCVGHLTDDKRHTVVDDVRKMLSRCGRGTLMRFRGGDGRYHDVEGIDERDGVVAMMFA